MYAKTANGSFIPSLSFPGLLETLPGGLLVLVALGGVLFFGANSPFYSLLLVGACGLVGLVIGAGGLLNRRDQGGFWRPPVWLLVPAGLLVVWATFQLLPLPAALRGLMNPVWSGALAALPAAGPGAAPHPALAVAPWDGLVILLRFLAYGLLFWLAAGVAGRGGAAARAVLAGLVFGGLGLCVYGLGTHLAGIDNVLWQPKVAYRHDVTGTFINRNTFATFAGLVLLGCLALLLARIGEVPPQARPRERWRAFLILVLRPRWAWLPAGALVLVALLLSQSRAGVLATFAGVVLLLALLTLAARPARRQLLVLMAVVGLLGLGGLLLASGPLRQRLDQLETDTAERAQLFTLTRAAARDNLWLGTGLGSFAEVFRQYRTPVLNLNMKREIDHAHNSWLESLLELGLPGFVMLLATVSALVGVYARGLRQRRRGVVWPALGLSALGLVSLHALVDFSLAIPGFTAYLAVMLGLCAGQSLPQRHTVSLRAAPVAVPPVPPARCLWPAAVLLPVALLLAVGGTWGALAAARVQKAEATLLAVRRQQVVGTGQLATARHQLRRAVRAWPHPQYLRNLGLLDLLLASRVGGATPAGQALLAEAATVLATGLARAPADPFSWYRLAQVRLQVGAAPATVTPLLLQSLLTGFYEPQLLWARLPLLVRLWSRLTPEDRTLAAPAFAAAWRADAKRTWRLLRPVPGGPALLASWLPADAASQRRWQYITATPWPGTVPAAVSAEPVKPPPAAPLTRPSPAPKVPAAPRNSNKGTTHGAQKPPRQHGR